MSRVANILARSKLLMLLFPVLLVLFKLIAENFVAASEFPERECCDPIYPIPEPTSKAPSVPTPTGRSGPNVKTAVAILNCLFARQLCFEDPSCSAILEIIPRVCGPELVACSTVTVTKCQAALKTLQAFSFFRPTCLCKEPHVDPECNSFQNFLFDHPCIYVLKKDKDPYPIDALLTCNHALMVCQRTKSCIKLFDDFKASCKIRENKCKMESREACHDAWTQLRLSPMFGCICPGNQAKKRCDKIFSTVNHNPCVDFLPFSASLDLSGTDSALYPFDPQQESFQEIWLPPTSMYPYFLFPATARTYSYNSNNDELDYDRHRHGYYGLPEMPGSAESDRTISGPGPHDRNPVAGSSSSSSASSPSYYHEFGGKHASNDTEHDLEKHKVDRGNQHHHHHQHQNHNHRHHHDNRPSAPSPVPAPPLSPSSSLPQPASPALQNEKVSAQSAPALRPGTNRFAPRPTYEHGPVVVDRIDDDFGLPIDRLFDLRKAFEGFVAQVKIISHPDNTTSFEIIESQLENPLIDADHQDLHALKQLTLPGFRHRPHHRKNHTTEDDDSSIDFEKIHQPVKLILSSTCHQAYSMCRNDTECRGLLQPILNHCDASSCARNECMNALQKFYKKANDSHSMEIAFCLCKKTQDKDDACIVAQEKMHPVCAQGHDLSEFPTCHSLALACREDITCRNKLEHYEQSCAVDSVTKKCAGPPADCRRAMLGILGTELRSNCACKGTELTQLYDCLGWQRLLWVNPCVVESQKDFHARKKHHHHSSTKPSITTLSTDSWSTSTTFFAVTPLITDSVEEDNVIPEVNRKSTTQPTMNDVDQFSFSSSVIISTTGSTSTTTAVTTPSTTTTSTPPPRFCVFQRPRQNHQYIREGKGKRLYRDNEPECSDLCQCGEGVTLVCNTICVQPSPCKTPFAFYNHAAPAYQAFRGRCLCYSGRFICMRPSPETYNIPHGVFMFLGYSETDEDFMKTYNNLTVLDAVNSLDSFIREEANNKTMCTLFLYNVTQENVIAVARLGGNNPPPNSSQAQSLQHLLRIKEECGAILQDLSDKINNKHQEVHTHPLLSIFKMAEVEVKLPQGSGATAIVIKTSLLQLIFILLTTTLINSLLLTTFNNDNNNINSYLTS
ncbi:glial cell line-derived neurotrophic family receptor-like [Cotesia typhae]|uniref:glial cell line-derived neurotrophic family receptor-like n=1 Tax=Cotesia typhae TaxID=2053667 RepID=UPI003D69076B